MKRIITLAEIFCLAGAVYAQQSVVMPAPTISARTNAVAKRIVRASDGATKSAQENRVMSVSAKVTFLSKPPLPYEVQCFFIAKNGATGERTVFDAAASTSQDSAANFEFASDPIAGGEKRWTTNLGNSTEYRSASSGGGYSGTISTTTRTVTTSKTAGNKIDGWIVRVVAQGKVLRAESNQPALTALAGKMTKELDEAAAKIDRPPK